MPQYKVRPGETKSQQKYQNQIGEVIDRKMINDNYKIQLKFSNNTCWFNAHHLEYQETDQNPTSFNMNFENINWELLSEQKNILTFLAYQKYPILEGILNLIDHIQDAANKSGVENVFPEDTGD